MSLEIHKIHSEQECARILADALLSSLNAGKKTLWLVPGGSNITIAVAALNLLLESAGEDINLLKMTLTDERYGQVGHKDSNWKQLNDVGFSFSRINSIPVLDGSSLDETVQKFSNNISELFGWADEVIAQFGIGADGHIGGVLPHTIGVNASDIAVGYKSGHYIRISISLITMRQIHKAYAFVFGDSKKEALINLQKEGAVDEVPSRVLKDINKSYLYTDQDIE